ncbi:hypothetical protein [Rhizobium leguminosarum]
MTNPNTETEYGPGEIKIEHTSVTDRDRLLTLAARLREYKTNPHHINPMSERFVRLIDEVILELSQLVKAGDTEAAKKVSTGAVWDFVYGEHRGNVSAEALSEFLERSAV